MSNKSRYSRRISVLLTAFLSLSLIHAAPVQAAAATITSLSPTAGKVSGNDPVTVTGSGFTGVTSLTVGSDTLTLSLNASLVAGEWELVSDTEIRFITPVRTGNSLTVGTQAVIVTNSTGNSNSTVSFTYRPIFESPNLNLVILGNLASRSQGKPVSRTSSSPYMVSGTDSTTSSAYTYETDFYYNPAANAYKRESVEATGSLTTNETDTDATTQVLYSSGGCTHNNNSIPVGAGATSNGSEVTYCSVFGPEIYTEAFYATSAQSIAFDWKAQGGGDDYEVYGFLVAVPDATTIPTPSTANHTLVLHNMGDVQSTFRTSAANIPTTGLFRFRFVNGTYDASGGKAIGAKMFIQKIVSVADANTITFPNLSDRIAASADTTDSFTFNLSSTSGAEVTVAKSGICTVTSTYSSPTTTVTVTKTSGTGSCSITASQGASGTYAPAANVTKAFDYRTAAVAPDAPTITSVTAGDGSLTVAFNAPNRDGGAAVTNYEYSIDGVNYIPLSPTSTTSPFVITGLSGGTSYTVTLKAINSVGSSTASSGVSRSTNSSQSSGNNTSSGSSANTCGVISNVNFLGDSAGLTYTTRMRLNALAKQLKAANCTSLVLSGHTATLTNSSIRTELRRVALAKSRNMAVQKYLESQLKKLSYSLSFSTATYQATQPLGSNKSAKGRVANRRVELSAN
jgi:outer membrane protein OmpA-like peptidoglycan-associated protein